MGLIDRIRRALSRHDDPPHSSGPVLRNKAGGMAWIKPFDTRIGAEVLVGRAVRTVRVEEGDKWVIDPPQEFTAAAGFTYCGRLFWPGDPVIVIGLVDELLEPWKEAGDDAIDESTRWLPPVPQVTRKPLEVKP